MNQLQLFTTKTKATKNLHHLSPRTALVFSLPWPNPWEAATFVPQVVLWLRQLENRETMLETWEDGSEAADYMALSCPVAYNDFISPARFHHHRTLLSPEQHPLIETGNPETWDNVKPLPHKLWGHLDFNNSQSNKSGLSWLWATLG